MSDNYLKELFIDEVKGALNQGGGGSGGVSSWNDLTDKPFDVIDGVTILDTTHIVLDSSNSEGPFLRNPFFIDLVIGETYIVT